MANSLMHYAAHKIGLENLRNEDIPDILIQLEPEYDAIKVQRMIRRRNIHTNLVEENAFRLSQRFNIPMPRFRYKFFQKRIRHELKVIETSSDTIYSIDRHDPMRKQLFLKMVAANYNIIKLSLENILYLFGYKFQTHMGRNIYSRAKDIVMDYPPGGRQQVILTFIHYYYHIYKLIRDHHILAHSLD